MKFIIETYGCQMNVADSELVTSILMEAGHTAVTDIEEADLILFNTCSIRQHAEDRVLGRISNERNRKKSKSGLKIGVIGCMAQRIGTELMHKNLGIDFVAGVDQYDKLVQIIDEHDQHEHLNFDESQIYDYIQPQHQTSICGFVTIVRGCNNFCSYCIVPYVRGRERSRPYESILKDIRNAASNGIQDITLLGQNVNSYHHQGMSFDKLLKRLNDETDISRFRFVTSHPKDLSDDLIEVMANADKVCEHIHLPVQSGDNETLSRMNRKYSIEHYLGLIQKLRSAIPDIAITTDVIAGFPGETDSQFENTIEVMREIGFDYAFCFKYSNRDGTLAAGYQGQIDEKIRLERLQKLIEIQRHSTKQKFESQIGRIVEVLVEGKSKHGGNQLSGKTRDFKICVFEGDDNQVNHLVKVKVTKATAGTLIGEQA